MAGALFAPMMPGPSVLLRIGSSSTFSNRCKRCPGVGAVELKEAHSPFPLRRAPNKEPPGRGSNGASALFIWLIQNPAYVSGTVPHGDAILLQTKGKDRLREDRFEKLWKTLVSIPDRSPIYLVLIAVSDCFVFNDLEPSPLGASHILSHFIRRINYETNVA